MLNISMKNLSMLHVKMVFSIICALSFLALGNLQAMNYSTPRDEASIKRHIVLLGASVGGAWNISELPNRVSNTDYTFEYVGEYAADKSQKLNSILERGILKPDAVIIKLCAAYFPGEPDKLKAFIGNWVRECRKEDVVPILATVVPVVRSFPMRTWLLSLLHGKWRYPKDPFGAIISFNDWIRNYAKAESLVVLDLEAALRTSQSDRHLDGMYAKADGLHINEKAYKELDKIVIPTLDRVEFRERRNIGD